MREIKFRAWDKETKTMKSLVQILWGHELSPYPLSVDFFGSVKSRLIEKVELMQFTGLKDKNGVPIYEGDYVTYGYTDESKKRGYKIWEVIWKGTEFKLKALNNFEKPRFDSLKTLQVMGNKWENPELLK